MEKNLIVDGRVNVGKSRNVIFPLVEEMILNKESFLVNDSKKEYYNYFSQKAKENGYNTLVINMDNPSYSDSINLFEIPYSLYKKGMKDEAFRIIETMIKGLYVTDGNQDPFWGNSASILVLSIIMKLFEDGNKDEINFKSVYSMLTKFANFDNKLLNNYFKSSGENSRIYNGATTVLNAPPETRGSIIAVAKQILFDSVIFDDMISMISTPSFDLESINEKPTAIFVISSNTNYSRNVLFDMILNLVNYVACRGHNKFSMILDNYDEISVYNIRELVSSANAYGISYIIGTRDMDSFIRNNSYLTKVSDLAYVSSNEIKYVVDGNEKVTINEKRNVDIHPAELPIQEVRDVKVFNIYEHISSDILKQLGKIKYEEVIEEL